MYTTIHVIVAFTPPDLYSLFPVLPSSRDLPFSSFRIILIARKPSRHRGLLWLELSQGLLCFFLLFASREKVVWQWWVREARVGFTMFLWVCIGP